MGIGAVYAFAEEMGMSFDDAEESLYGHRNAKPPRPKCPLCGKRFGGDDGVLAHLKSGFHKPTEKLAATIEELEPPHV